MSTEWMESNRNKSVDGGVNGLTAGVVLDMHGNVTDEQAGFPGPLTQCEPRQGESTQTYKHRNVCAQSAQSQGATIHATQRKGEHTSWLVWDISARWLLTCFLIAGERTWSPITLNTFASHESRVQHFFKIFDMGFC